MDPLSKRYGSTCVKYQLIRLISLIEEAFGAIALQQKFRTFQEATANTCFALLCAIKHPVSDRVKPSFVIFDTRAL